MPIARPAGAFSHPYWLFEIKLLFVLQQQLELWDLRNRLHPENNPAV
jgi:hypothetical protein